MLERLEDNDFNNLPSEVINERWFGYSGATDSEITAAESRLEMTLPPSYKGFLRVSNGWRGSDKDFSRVNNSWRAVDMYLSQLLPIQNVDWLSTTEPTLYDDWMSGWESEDPTSPVSDKEYFVYGDEQDSASLRNEYLQTALEIGNNKDNGNLLLNPQIVFEDRELEAWMFSPLIPGAIRYKSLRINDR